MEHISRPLAAAGASLLRSVNLNVTLPPSSVGSLLRELADQPLPTLLLAEHLVFTCIVLWMVRWLLRQDLARLAMKVALGVVKRLPGGKAAMDREQNKVLQQLDQAVNKPNEALGEIRTAFPRRGTDRAALLQRLKGIKDAEWDYVGGGRAFGGVYGGLDGHSEFLNEVYSIFSSSNALYPDLFPSARKFEVELIHMAIDMMNGEPAECCGSFTSGGTESILMACKTYRDWGRAVLGIEHPEMVIAESAHPAFDKAAHYFGIKVVKVPVDKSWGMDVSKAKRAVSRSTVAMVASAPSFPHGIVDPIEELGAVAASRGIGLHVDCCLGGFLVPWYKRLGVLRKNFDFSVKGVTSISADVHKFGFANKGASLILYSRRDLRMHQFFVSTDWSGGLYASPAISGARSGALIAQAWASVMVLGEEGFLRVARDIWDSHKKLVEGLNAIPGLYVLGEPDACIVAFTSSDSQLDIYRVAQAIEELGWEVARMQRPKCIHVATHVRNARLTDQYLKDVAEAVRRVRANPQAYNSGLTPVYGMAATLPERGIISDLLKAYMDRLYTPPAANSRGSE